MSILFDTQPIILQPIREDVSVVCRRSNYLQFILGTCSCWLHISHEGLQVWVKEPGNKVIPGWQNAWIRRPWKSNRNARAAAIRRDARRPTRPGGVIPVLTHPSDRHLLTTTRRDGGKHDKVHTIRLEKSLDVLTVDGGTNSRPTRRQKRWQRHYTQ